MASWVFYFPRDTRRVYDAERREKGGHQTLCSLLSLSLQGTVGSWGATTSRVLRRLVPVSGEEEREWESFGGNLEGVIVFFYLHFELLQWSPLEGLVEPSWMLWYDSIRNALASIPADKKKREVVLGR